MATELGSFTAGQILTAADMNIIGTWTAFTPSWVNLTPGNGVVSAAYCEINRVFFVRVKLTWGTTTSCTDPVRMTLPASLTQNTGSQELIGLAQYTDTGVASYIGYAFAVSSTVIGLGVMNSAATYTAANNVNNTRPFTFGNTDIMAFEFTTRLA
jgi:hypothetical protein